MLEVCQSFWPCSVRFCVPVPAKFSLMMTGAFAVGGVSGGAFNPAVAVGITLMGLQTWSNFWVFLVGNFGGAAVAAVTYKLVNGDE